MKKFYKVSLIAGGIITCTGLACMGIGLIANADITGHIYRENNNIVFRSSEDIVYETKSLELEPFTDIDIDVDYADIEIIKSDTNAVEYVTSDSIDYSQMEVVDGVLTIKQVTEDKWLNIDFSLMDTSNRDIYIKVYVDSDQDLNSLTIEESAGDIRVEQLEFAGNVDISNDFGDIICIDITTPHLLIEDSSGDVELSQIDADKVEVTVDFGGISASSISADEYIIYNSAGDIEVAESVVGKFDITADFGGIYINKSTCDSFIASNSSGDVTYDGTINKIADISLDFGDVSCTLSGNEADYGMTLATDFGEITVDNRDSGSKYSSGSSADKTINIENSSGDISVDFN